MSNKGLFVNGRRVITQDANALLKTLDPCLLPSGKPMIFDNWATSLDLIASTAVRLNGAPVLNQGSVLKTTYGSEAARAGIKSGTIGGPCHFTTSSPNVFINDQGVLRDGDLGTANHHNTAPAPIIHPERFAPLKHPFEFSFDTSPLHQQTTHQIPIQFNYTDARPFACKGLRFRLSPSDRFTYVVLDAEGKGTLYLSQAEKQAETLVIRGWEMLDANQMPCIEQRISLSHVASQLQITLLPPACTINVRTDAIEVLSNQEPLLSEEALAYFKKKHALIFLTPGFLPLGSLGYYPLPVNTPPGVSIQYPRTLTDPRCLNETKTMAEHRSLKEGAHGSGSLWWQTLLEYQLNVAANGGAIDYRKYTRLIGFHWNSVAGAVPRATVERLCALLQLLSDNGIRTQVIAYHQGAELLKQALSHLSDLQALRAVVLWQATCQNTDFSSLAHEQIFCLPHLVEQFGVLYSAFDDRLKIATGGQNYQSLPNETPNDKLKLELQAQLHLALATARGTTVASATLLDHLSVAALLDSINCDLTQFIDKSSTAKPLQYQIWRNEVRRRLLTKSSNYQTFEPIEIDAELALVHQTFEQIFAPIRCRLQTLGLLGPVQPSNPAFRLATLDQGSSLQNEFDFLLPTSQFLQTVYMDFILKPECGLKHFGAYF